MSTPENYLLTIGARNDRIRAQAKPLEKQLRDLDTEYQAASRRPITDVVSPGRGRHSPRPVPDVLPHDFPVSGVAVLDLDGMFQRLIENHLPLVRSIVERMRRKLPNKIETDELYSIGVTGLVSAARNYRPCRESSFASYATTRIRGAILDELRRMDWMSRGSAISKLEQEQGGSISNNSLCAEMHMTEEELAELMDEVRPVKFVSFDGVDEQSDVEDQSLHEIIPDDSCIPPLEALERKEILSLLAQRMAQLPPVPKRVLAMYYYENLRLSDIAGCFGLTKSRICQIHTQAVASLKTSLTNLLA
jgi:RNA polymerase sigma factor FliA